MLGFQDLFSLGASAKVLEFVKCRVRVLGFRLWASHSGYGRKDADAQIHAGVNLGFLLCSGQRVFWVHLEQCRLFCLFMSASGLAF